MEKPRATVVTIGRTGIRDGQSTKRYYAEWMKQHIGEKVYAVSDLFNPSCILVYNADSDVYLGMAALMRGNPVQRIINRYVDNLNREAALAAA